MSIDLRKKANSTKVISKPFNVVDGKIVEIIVPRGTITGGGCRKGRIKGGF